MVSLLEKREKLLTHYANRAYVAQNAELLRRTRGVTSQALVALMADVAQSYISRVESGSTAGIGADPLRRILAVYKELEECSRILTA